MKSFNSDIVIEKIKQTIIEGITVNLGAGLDKVKSISVGNPGDIDRQSGTSVFLQNCPEWKNVPIVSELQETFNCPVFLENIILFMANCERDKMEDARKEDFVYIALKTGVGAGVCIDGELYSGFKGNAGHLGHLPVMSPSAVRTKRLEECAGGFMILNRMKEYCLLKNHTCEFDSVTKDELDILTDEAEKGNPSALRILEEVADYWAYAIATVICHLDIPQFIFGGLISYINQRSEKVGNYFLDAVTESCIEKYLFTEVPAFRISFSEYNDYTAALGGALYGYENFFHQIIKVGEKSIAINVN
jgi:glucokinase